MQHSIRFHEDTAFTLIKGHQDAPTTIFVHGVGLDQSLWQPWLDRLPPEFTLIAFDLLGHGQSKSPDGLRNIAQFVDQIDALVEHLQIERFSLIGFSLGALIGLAYASMHSKLSHLVLLHPVYRRNQEQINQVHERLNIAQQQGPNAYIELALKRWFTKSYRATHPNAMNGLRARFKGNQSGYLNAYRLFADAEQEMHTYDMNRIQCPTLIITGGEDTGSTPAMTKALAHDLHDAQYLINPGHRHMAPVEFAETLCGQCRSFLMEHR